jgi:hypothetical protein
MSVSSFLIPLIVGSALAALFAAVILRGSVALYNKVAGGGAYNDNYIPGLTYGQAWKITFVIMILQNVVGTFLTPTGGKMAGGAIVASMVVSIGVMTAVLSSMLPTTIARALAVTVCYIVIATVLMVVVAGIVVGIIAGAK